MSMKKIIVDCDAGSDDAVSLILFIAAHKSKKIELKAITCVAGNTSVENVVKNVFRILYVCDALDIPVYKGAYSSLISTESLIKATEITYHGGDGFGDIFTDEIDITPLKNEHAIIGLHKIITKNPNEISVVCLGPMTNIALAIKIYPEILNDIKDFFAMGGNFTGVGNTTSQAEFNFYFDPESVHIVFQNNTKPFWLLPYETCLKSNITLDWRDNIFGKRNTKQIELINKIESGVFAKKLRPPFYTPCDAIIAAVVINPNLDKKIVEHHADIELNGTKTRGQVVIDHLKKRKPNILLIEQIDFDGFKELLLSGFDFSYKPNVIKNLI